jgi:arylsulfatase A-like enzyme
MLQRTAEIDAQIGRIMQSLAEKNMIDDTLIILLADHGDDFWEHGEPTHRQFLYDTTLLVPLIIYPRIGKRLEVAEQVRLVDILPTVLNLLGVDFSEEIDGESLLPLLNTNDLQVIGSDPRKAYSETLFEVKTNGASDEEIRTCLASLRAYPWKLIWDRLKGSYEIYRVDRDPRESQNLIEEHQEMVEKLSAELHHLAQEMPLETGQVDDLMVDRLKALGYL